MTLFVYYLCDKEWHWPTSFRVTPTLKSCRGERWRSGRFRVTYHQFGSFQTPRLGPNGRILSDNYRIDWTWIMIVSTWGHNGCVEPSAAAEPPGPGTVQWSSDSVNTHTGCCHSATHTYTHWPHLQTQERAQLERWKKVFLLMSKRTKLQHSGVRPTWQLATLANAKKAFDGTDFRQLRVCGYTHTHSVAAWTRETGRRDLKVVVFKASWFAYRW